MEEMELFRLFDEVSEWCWKAVISWPLFAQRTIGEQLVRAADSVAANLIEGDGRFGVGDALRFFYIARASARETRMWLRKATLRGLVGEAVTNIQIEKLTKATRLLNVLIRYRKERGNFDSVRESIAAYDADFFTEN